MHTRIGLTTWRRASTEPQDTALVKATIDELYADGVSDAGGLPLLLPSLKAEQIETALTGIDGLILTGGGDVCPTTYNAENVSSSLIDNDRDGTEIALIRKAIDLKVPMFGICRGLQILNVAFGGTLRQEVQAESEEHPSTVGVAASEILSQRHEVTIEPGSDLERIYGRAEMTVNSLHHQGVDVLAQGFNATARAGDGTIEAIESADGSGLVFAVQWHPEKMLSEGGDILFADFVNRCRNPRHKS